MKETDFAIELLRQGRTVSIVGRGNSMRPYLVHERDKIVLAPVDSINVGDVVFATPAADRHVAHRVVRVDGDDVTLMGDGNMSCEKCNVDDIHGKAVGFIRKGRDKIESADSLAYRLYSWIWMHLPLVVRRYCLALHNMLFWSFKDLSRITPTEAEEALLLALTRISLWGESTEKAEEIIANRGIRWNAVLDLAKRQTLMGLAIDAIRRLPDNMKPTKEVCDDLTAKLRKSLLTHEKLNTVAIRIMELFQSHGIHAVLLKGQGTAARYPNPILRQCGDIDVYVGRDNCERATKCIAELVGEDGLDQNLESPKHAHAHYGNIPIEIHRITERHHYFSVRERYIKDSEAWLKPESCDKVMILGKEVNVPPRQFNSLYTFFHLWHHFLTSGIGFRHICDLCVLLHDAYGKIDTEKLSRDLRDYKMLRGWQIIGWLAVNKFGLPKEEMPCYSEKYEEIAQKVWEMILEGGNFRKSYYKRKTNHHWVVRKMISLCYMVMNTVKMYPAIGVESLYVFAFLVEYGTERTKRKLFGKNS